ncbi:uncharacterized [Tachysurus ichikawai]
MLGSVFVTVKHSPGAIQRQEEHGVRGGSGERRQSYCFYKNRAVKSREDGYGKKPNLFTFCEVTCLKARLHK